MSTDPTAGKIHGHEGYGDEHCRKDGFFDGIKATHVIELVLAAALVVVACRQADLTDKANRIAAVALSAAKDSADSAKESADAGRQAVEISSDTAIRQLRAYVLPSGAEIRGLNQNGPIQVAVAVKNYGQTPAFDATIEVVTRVDAGAGPGAGAGALQTEEGAPITFGAGEAVYVNHKVSKTDLDYARRLNSPLVALCTVTYRDIYGRDHMSHFHFVQTSIGAATMKLTKSDAD